MSLKEISLKLSYFQLLSLAQIFLGLERKFVEGELILLSLIKKFLDLDWKLVEGDLILLSLVEISLDLDRKFVEREANFVS